MIVSPAGLLTIRDKIVRFWQSPTGAVFGRGFMESVQAKSGGIIIAPPDAARGEATALTMGTSYLVLPDMCDLVFHATVSMPSQALREEDLPEPTGCVWFDKPVEVWDVHEERYEIPLAVWYPRMARMPDGEHLPCVWTSYYCLTRPQDSAAFREAHGPVSLFHVQPQLIGVDYEAPNPERGLEPARALRAFWTLVQQRLTSTETVEPLGRAGRRAAQRESRPIPRVNVVELRRSREHRERTGSPASVDWSHRWIVSGHWRQQWYPSIQDHRRLWIDAFEKGPADKELVIKQRVIKWSKEV